MGEWRILKGMKNLIVEFIREVLAEKRHKKPGGPRTDMGAIRQINPGEFSVRVKSAVVSAGGDVSSAADNLDVSSSTLYHYLNDDPGLDAVKTGDDYDEEAKK